VYHTKGQHESGSTFVGLLVMILLLAALGYGGYVWAQKHADVRAQVILDEISTYYEQCYSSSGRDCSCPMLDIGLLPKKHSLHVVRGESETIIFELRKDEAVKPVDHTAVTGKGLCTYGGGGAYHHTISTPHPVDEYLIDRTGFFWDTLMLYKTKEGDLCFVIPRELTANEYELFFRVGNTRRSREDLRRAARDRSFDAIIGDKPSCGDIPPSRSSAQPQEQPNETKEPLFEEP